MASIFWIPLIFAANTGLLYWMSIHLPGAAVDDSTNNSTTTSIGFPSNLEELSALATFLSEYKQQHLVYVLALFSTAYLWKQTFAIPGSVFLNLLAGAIFGAWIGFPLACILTAIGATNCYLLSKFFGKSYIIKYFPGRIKQVQEKIEENMDSLFFFLLFLRLFPMSPNWFMNMVAPILNVPVPLFFFSVFFGLMPYNFICVQTGCFLSQLTSVNDIFTIWMFLKLMLFANIALIPGVLLKNYHTRKQTERKRVAELSDKIRQKEEELLALEREEEELRKLQEFTADLQRRQGGGATLTELPDDEGVDELDKAEDKKQL